MRWNGSRYLTCVKLLSLLGFFLTLDPVLLRRVQLPLDSNPYRLNSMGISSMGQQSKVRAPRVITVTDHWITTFFCSVFTPPFLFCAVIVMTLSPSGSGGVK